MATNGEKLKSIVELYQRLNNIDWHNGSIVNGTLCVDGQMIDLLKIIDDMDLELVVQKEGKKLITSELENLAESECVQVSFQYPRNPNAFFAKSFEEFLPNYGFKYQQPTLFYLADKKLLIKKDDVVKDPLIFAYQAVLELIELIETNDISDHHPPDPERYFLFLGHKQKFRLSIKYTAQNLKNGGDDIRIAIDRLKQFIQDGVHLGDKRLLLKKTIIEMLAPQGEAAGFAFLIENLSELVSRFIGNFELYAGKYTFEDEKQKLLIEIRDYFRSINDAISSAQLRLVAIPLTLLIVISKMGEATSDINTLSNTAMLFGVFIFAILMGRLTHSQKETLDAEKVEIDSRKKQISEKYAELYTELKGQFVRLDKRLVSQRTTLIIINGAIILVCLLTTLAFFYYNTPKALSVIVFP